MIGSRPQCRIHLESNSVSQQHALLVRSGGTYYIHDLASRKHVFVNDEQVQTKDLTNGAMLKVGLFPFKFIGPAVAPPHRPAPPALLRSNERPAPLQLDHRVLLIG
ncbi:MAG: FHA domain-containing protein, partial [Phycisphaerae bacterium]|nr:FHA domain-containing protein [Phycisphaerae bacterium]